MKREITQNYRSAPEDSEFDQWLTSNAIIASLFAAVIIGMAVFAAVAPAPTQSADRGAPGTQVQQTEHPVAQGPAIVHDEVVGATGRTPEFSARQDRLAPN